MANRGQPKKLTIEDFECQLRLDEARRGRPSVEGFDEFIRHRNKPTVRLAAWLTGVRRTLALKLREARWWLRRNWNPFAVLMRRHDERLLERVAVHLRRELCPQEIAVVFARRRDGTLFQLHGIHRLAGGIHISWMTKEER